MGQDMSGMRKRDRTPDRYPAARVFHEHAAEYDGWFDDSLVYGIELAALQSLAGVMPGPKLEIGVGPGRFAGDLGVDFGLDPAGAPLHLARQRGVVCCRGIGEELPFKDKTFGTAYLLFTLCFSRNPRKIIEECRRILKKGGCLVIGIIPAGGTWGINLTAKKEAGHMFYKHAVFYSIATVRLWLAEVNMPIDETRSTLYQAPGHVEHREGVRELLDEKAGFVVITARKDHA